jgi:cold shock CspA family protein
VYVYRNAVVDGGFDRLKVGDRVRYVVDPEEGEKGAQASAVIPFDSAK